MTTYAHLNPDVFLDPSSLLLKGVQVWICERGSTTLASIFSSSSGAAKANPFTTDADTGAWDAYAAPGKYSAKVGSAPTGAGDPGFIDITVHADTDADNTFTAALVVKWDAGRYDPRGWKTGTPTAKLQSAINAAWQDEGGNVRNITDTTIEAPLMMKPGVYLKGATRRRSTLKAATDFGSPNLFLVDFDPAELFGFGDWVIDDLTLEGPGGAFTPAIGSRNCQMGGVRVPTHGAMNRTIVQMFGEGIRQPNDHNVFTHVYAKLNWDNVVRPDYVSAGGDAVTGGDHLWLGGGITHHKRAGLVCKGSQTAFNDLFSNVKIGYGPISLLRENGLAVASVAWLVNMVFDGVTFENYGNYILLDNGTATTGPGAVSMIADVFNNAHALSNPSSLFRDPAMSHDVACKVQGMRGNVFKGAALPWAVPNGGTAVWEINSTLCISNEWHCPYPGQSGSIPLGAGQMFRGTATSGWKVDFGEMKADVRLSAGTILRGDLLEWFGNSTHRRLTSGGTFAGVAVNDANTGDKVIVAPPGERTVAVNSEVVALGGTLLYRDATIPYHASPTVNGSPIGVSMTGGGAAGGTAQVFMESRH